MRKLNLQLDRPNAETEKIILEETEDNILLVLERKPHLQSMFYTLSNEPGYSITTPTSSETFLRPQKLHYTHIQLQGNFVNDSYIKITMFLGLWSEILLIDLSLNLDFLYQNAEPDQVAFRIGLPNMSNLLIKITSEGHYEIVRTLITSQTAVQTTHEVVLSSMAAAKDIKMLYERIKSNINNNSFAEKQLAQIDILSQNTFDFLINY